MNQTAMDLGLPLVVLHSDDLLEHLPLWVRNALTLMDKKRLPQIQGSIQEAYAMVGSSDALSALSRHQLSLRDPVASCEPKVIALLNFICTAILLQERLISSSGSQAKSTITSPASVIVAPSTGHENLVSAPSLGTQVVAAHVKLEVPLEKAKSYEIPREVNATALVLLEKATVSSSPKAQRVKRGTALVASKEVDHETVGAAKVKMAKSSRSGSESKTTIKSSGGAQTAPSKEPSSRRIVANPDEGGSLVASGVRRKVR